MADSSTSKRYGVIDRDALIASIEATAGRYGLSMAEFVRAGEADELVDDELRDLWLSVSAVLMQLVS